MTPSTSILPPSSAPGRRLLGRTGGAPWSLVALATLVGLAVLLPLAYLVLRAAGLGLEAVLSLVFSPRTLVVAWNSIVLAVLVTGISLVISLPLAWLTVRTDLPGRQFWAVVLALPLAIPTYVGSYALVSAMGPRGILQGWLEGFGVERLPSLYGLPGAVWALTIFSYPYLYLSIRAGLRNLDPALEEAARSLGSSPRAAFWRVTLPGLRPAIVSGSLLLALYVLSDFGAVSIMRFNSFTRAIYVQYQASFDRSQAAVLSLVLVAMTLFLLVVARRIQGRHRYHRVGTGTARRPRVVALRGWKWPALAFCGAVVAAALVLPLLVVLFWLVRGLTAGEILLPVAQAAFNSVYVSVLAALVAVVAALPVAYFAVRFPSRYSSLIGRVAFLGFGLPGIVIALSLVFVGANYLPFLYQTLAMLIFAYTVRFLPEALGPLRTGLLQISPRLEEAARALGLSRRRTVYRVTLPLLRPGIWSGAALVFLTTIKELPATLLLAPTGFTTLAIQIWSATSEAFYARAAAPALLLVAVSTLGVLLMAQQEGREFE